jgi:hypothetical protein
VIGVKIAVGLLGLGLALLPGTTRAAPTDEAPKEGQLDPEYAAGEAAIVAKDWTAAIRVEPEGLRPGFSLSQE